MHRDLCSLLWAMWQMSMHFYMSMQIRMLMSSNILKKNHERIYTFPFFLCLTLTYTQTMLEQHEISRACWDFLFSAYMGECLRRLSLKALIHQGFLAEGFVSEQTHTQVTSTHAYGAKANICTFLPSYHMLSLHSSTPTNKVLVNNQTHPSIHPSYLS